MRERVKGWKRLTLITDFNGAKMRVVVNVFGSFLIRPK